MKKHLLIKTFSCLCLLIFSIYAIYVCTHRCKKEQTSRKTSTFFTSDSVISISLIFDIDAFEANNEGKRFDHIATLKYTEANKQAVELRVKVKLQGQFRTDTANCNMPQLKVKFDKQKKDYQLFKGIKNADLVFPCKKNTEAYEQYLIQEYLLYKMYNLFTSNSYQVRMVKLQLINTGTKKDTLQTLAFFRESDEDMANRLDGKIMETMPIDTTKINETVLKRMAIFQYIIGNEDWSERYMHNIKMLEKEDKSLYAIPYDFDFCGLISTPYANFDSLDFYRNTSIDTTSELNKYLITDYLEKHDSCILLFQKNAFLLPTYKKKSIDYLQKFFLKNKD